MQSPDLPPLRGALTYPEICSYLELDRPWKDRLVVTPLIDPTRQLGSNSIDLRLGSEFLVINHERIPSLDLSRDPAALEVMLRKAHEFLRVDIGGSYVLHEHEFVLATTLEFVSLPETLAGLVFGRSSWDRLGIAVPTTRIPPGFKGCISIQIVSHTSVPVTLMPGTRICQLMLFPVSSPIREHSRYGVILHPIHSRIYEDPEMHTLVQRKFPLIVGITGTLASGKSTVAEYLVSQRGFLHLSLTTAIYDEVQRRNLTPVSKELQNIGDSLRRLHGAAVLAQRVRPRMEALPGGSNLVLEGIKNVAEVQELRKWDNFKLLAVEASEEIRFQRMIHRIQTGSRAGSPPTEAECHELDRRDRGIGEPGWGQGVDRCVEEADIVVENNGSLDDLYQRLEEHDLPNLTMMVY